MKKKLKVLEPAIKYGNKVAKGTKAMTHDAIAKKAGKPKEAGKRVAGAILAKICAKHGVHESEDFLDEGEKKEPTQHEKNEKVANAVIAHMTLLKKAKGAGISEGKECTCKTTGKKKCSVHKESGPDMPLKTSSGNVADEGRV